METPEEGGAKAGTFYLLGNIRSGPEGRVEGEGRRGVGTEDGPGNGRFFTTSKGEERRQAAHETHRTKLRWEHGAVPHTGCIHGRGDSGFRGRAFCFRDEEIPIGGAGARLGDSSGHRGCEMMSCPLAEQKAEPPKLGAASRVSW